MKRMIDATPTSAVVTTTNGATTTTEMLFARELKEYETLPNGFRPGLAKEVLGNIERREGRLWDQGSWRRRLDPDFREDVEALEIEAPWLLLDVEGSTTACGTAMCYAGWTAELTGADHIIDAGFLKRLAAGEPIPGISVKHGSYALDNLVDSMDDFVMVRRDDPLFARYLEARHRTGSMPYPSDPDIQKHLATRGFSKESHVMVAISCYAAISLGIITYYTNDEGYELIEDYDPRCLFAAANSFVELQAIVDCHTEFGCNEENELSPTDKEYLRYRLMRHGRDEVAGYLHEALKDELEPMVALLREQQLGYDYHAEHAPAWARARVDA